MDINNSQLPEKLHQPDALAAFIRGGYKSNFYPEVISLGAAIFFALWHRNNSWLLAIGFSVSAVLYFWMGLSLYWHQKQICEKAIRNYEKWYNEHNSSSESKP